MIIHHYNHWHYRRLRNMTRIGITFSFLLSVVVFVVLPIPATGAVSMKELWRQGDAAFNERCYDLAADYYLKALLLAKTELHTAQLANNLFFVYKTTQDRSKALRFFRVSSEAYQKNIQRTTDPEKLSRLFLLLGKLHMENIYEEKEYRKAEEFLQTALRAFASSGEGGTRKAEALFHLGMFLGADGRDNEALPALREAASTDFENALYTYTLGCALVILSNKESAASTLRRLRSMEGAEASRYTENLSNFAAAMGLDIATSRPPSENTDKKGTGIMVGDFEAFALPPEAGVMAGSFVRSALIPLLDDKTFRVMALTDLNELDFMVDGALSGLGRAAVIEVRLIQTSTFRIVASFSEQLHKVENLPAVCRKLANALAEHLKKEAAEDNSNGTGESIINFLDPMGRSESYLFTQKLDEDRFNVWIKRFYSSPEKKRKEGELLGFGESVETAIIQYIYEEDGHRYAVASEKYFNIRNEMLAKKTPRSLQWEPMRYGELPHVMYLAGLRKHRGK